MREIKFRGKLLDNDKWAIGDLRHRNDGSLAIITNLNVWSDNNDKVDAYGEEFEVDPATVGQYTGLKDKKGRDIYEGDIILFGGICFEISYADGCFWFSNEEETMELHTTVGMGDIEITGNIHDNPELLKGE